MSDTSPPKMPRRPLKPELRRHPLAEILPPRSDEQRQQLLADIQRTNQRQPVSTTHDGAFVVNGWHVKEACERLSRKVLYSKLPAVWDEARIADYILSEATSHRHLEPSQLAYLAKWWADRYGVHELKQMPRGKRPKLSELAARRVGVSKSMVEMVTTLAGKGTEEDQPRRQELMEQVRLGTITVNAALVELGVRARKAVSDQNQKESASGEAASPTAPRKKQAGRPPVSQTRGRSAPTQQATVTEATEESKIHKKIAEHMEYYMINGEDDLKEYLSETEEQREDSDYKLDQLIDQLLAMQKIRTEAMANAEESEADGEEAPRAPASTQTPRLPPSPQPS